ncbi:MAG: 16S rRNA (uracil(1498)-N(3))-methyltransferase [Leptolyngbyaceae cyanobacterium bins.59]|nr:16S rRNA (uracil(1498)-N(3))-methyltransferase [Leptolyngbyaceae cyanobacterium bins.59]
MVPSLQRVTIAPHQLTGQEIHLEPDQEHYLRRVLRLQRGDRFIAMDGQGHWWLTELIVNSPGSDGLTAKILETIAIETELPIPLTLVIALPKGNGFDEVVRQVTELGVTRIQPVISDRTLLQPGPQKLERWRRIAQEAAEQAERQTIPSLLDPIPFRDSLTPIAGQERRFFCATREKAPHLLDCLRDTAGMGEVTIAIGPEGGWTEMEIQQAIAAAYQPVSLGQRILRAVTAPLMAAALVAAALESKDGIATTLPSSEARSHAP